MKSALDICLMCVRQTAVGLAIAIALTACSSSKETKSTVPVPAQTGGAQAGGAQTAASIAPAWAQTGRAIEAAPIAPARAQVAGAIQMLGAKDSDREVRIVLPADVLFDFDKSDIRPDAANGLQRTLTVTRFYKTAPIRIEGHTDSMGDDSYNRALSDRRANSVKQWLITQGQVANDRMSTKGFGKTQPRVANTKPNGSDDPAGRQQNRRVELVIEKQ